MHQLLRIALVSAFPPGRQSLNEYGYHLARGLAARTDVAEVVVIADRLDGPISELDLGPKVRVERVWDFNSVRTLPRVLKALRDCAPDGVVWNLQTATFGDREIPAALGLMAPAAARLFGLRSGVIAHNVVACMDLDDTLLQGQYFRQLIVRAGGAVVTRALMASNYVTVTLRGYFDDLSARYPRANIHHVPHGTFETETRPNRPLSKRPRRIVTMGKFGTYKRLETLLAAFDVLRASDEFSDIELVIGGSDHPGTPGYLDAVAADRRHDRAVRFHGYVAEDDIPSFFESAYLSVFDYSSTTGSSGVLHQTASYGAVPVFPRIGDFIDVCKDEGISGANYAPQDHSAMAKAMALMLRDMRGAQRIADANRTAAAGMPFSEVVRFHVEHFYRPHPGADPRLTEPA